MSAPSRIAVQNFAYWPLLRTLKSRMLTNAWLCQVCRFAVISGACCHSIVDPLTAVLYRAVPQPLSHLVAAVNQPLSSRCVDIPWEYVGSLVCSSHTIGPRNLYIRQLCRLSVVKIDGFEWRRVVLKAVRDKRTHSDMYNTTPQNWQFIYLFFYFFYLLCDNIRTAD